MKPLLILAPLALAGCNNSPTVVATNATANQVDAKLAASGGAQFLSAGRWEGSATFTDLQIPGMPAETAAKMKDEMGKRNSFASCLTEAEARKPAAGFFAGGEKDCRYDHFAMTNGRLDAAMSCKSESGTQNMTMQGSFTSDSFQLSMTTKSSGAAGQPMSAATMAMKIDAHRTGACKGDENS
jgi:hypothetical protein